MFESDANRVEHEGVRHALLALCEALDEIPEHEWRQRNDDVRQYEYWRQRKAAQQRKGVR